MKKLILFLTFTVAMLVMASCDDGSEGPKQEVIWDINPTGISIFLVDEKGNNLLDPATQGNWIGEEIIMTYEGEAYNADWEYCMPKTGTRYLMAIFDGLVWTGWLSSDSKYNLLYFGGFNGDYDLDISLNFSIPALNLSYDIRFTHEFYWEEHKPKRKDHIYFNGEDINGDELRLVIPLNPNYESSIQ